MVGKKITVFLCTAFQIIVLVSCGQGNNTNSSSKGVVSETSKSSDCNESVIVSESTLNSENGSWESISDISSNSSEERILPESCEIEMNSSKLFDGEKFDDTELVEKAVKYYDFVLDNCQHVEYDNRNGRKGMYIKAVLSDAREVYIPDFSDYYVSVDGQYYYDESGELTEFSNYIINLMTEKGYWKY